MYDQNYCSLVRYYTLGSQIICDSLQVGRVWVPIILSTGMLDKLMTNNIGSNSRSSSDAGFVVDIIPHHNILGSSGV